MTTESRNVRGLVGPMILIAIGLLLLLANLGIVQWNVWAFLARFWPVALIAVGVDILLGGRSRGAVVAGVLILGAVLWFGWSTPLGSVAAQGESITVSQSLEGASRAELRLAPGVARLSLSAGSDEDLLIAGTVVRGRGETIDQQFDRNGQTASYSIASRRSGAPIFGDNSARVWDLEVNPRVPLDLVVDAGVGRVDLDLSELSIADLSLNLGVGETLVVLPREGSYEASIEAGVGEVRVRLPRGVAARIRADRGVGSIDVSGEFERDGELFVSPGFAAAAERIDLRIDGGVGSIDVETY